jgi:cation transport ATPase
LQVIAKKSISTSEADLLAWAGSLERLSTHPIASCIVACAAVAGSTINLDVTAFENLPGAFSQPSGISLTPQKGYPYVAGVMITEREKVFRRVENSL